MIRWSDAYIVLSHYVNQGGTRLNETPAFPRDPNAPSFVVNMAGQCEDIRPQSYAEDCNSSDVCCECAQTVGEYLEGYAEYLSDELSATQNARFTLPSDILDAPVGQIRELAGLLGMEMPE